MTISYQALTKTSNYKINIKNQNLRYKILPNHKSNQNPIKANL